MSTRKVDLINSALAGLGSTAERSMRMNQRAAARLGINASDMQVLQLLQAGPRTSAELAKLTGLTTASMTGLIDRLEKADFVRRVRDDSDRRKVLVHLNDDRARADIAPLYGALLGTWRRALSGYSIEELGLIVDFLTRVEQGFDAELGTRE
ncbi:MarR family transcriptional regulator [Nocardia sp. CDC153]|uniref:MarR family winged helix-turn-helix transcriptional regulator n=1 Tax=Nocardia sp. CDC153 TaxID=3112167 RepID=UPI002DB7CD48|nr:MarR family transcriptional regulator [Nocardia sp. CDC153]MEC3956821.1 MarR family transcriptional regulator [Nocardia sp. CDC153]